MRCNYWNVENINLPNQDYGFFAFFVIVWFIGYEKPDNIDYRKHCNEVAN